MSKTFNRGQVQVDLSFDPENDNEILDFHAYFTPWKLDEDRTQWLTKPDKNGKTKKKEGGE